MLSRHGHELTFTLVYAPGPSKAKSAPKRCTVPCTKPTALSSISCVSQLHTMLFSKRLLAASITLVAATAEAGQSLVQPRKDDKPSQSALQEVESERKIYETASYLLFEGHGPGSGNVSRGNLTTRQLRPGGSSLQRGLNMYYTPPGFQSNIGMHYANVSVGGEDDNIKFLGTERFHQEIQGASCTKDSIIITFKDEARFQSIKTEWTWVNEKVGHNIWLITETEQCNAPDGDQTSRQPWLVTGAEFDDTKNHVTLEASPKSFQEAFGKNFRLSVTRQDQAAGSLRRDSTHSYNKRGKLMDASIDLNHNFSGLGVELPKDFRAVVGNDEPVGAIECNPCLTYGAIDFEIDISGSIKGIEGKASITVRGVGATINANLYIYQKLLDRTMEDQVIWGFVPPLCGIYIKGVMDFGPTVKALLSASLASKPEGQSVLSMGYNLTVPDSSEFSVGLSTSKGFEAKIDGWNPSFKPLTPAISKDFSIEGNVGPKLGLSLDGNVLGQGVSVGFQFSAATLAFNVTAESTNPVCNNPDWERGAKVDLGLVQEVNAVQTAHVLAWRTSETQTLARTSYDLVDTCISAAATTTVPLVHPTQEKNHYIPADNGLEQLAREKAKLVASAFKTGLASHVTAGFKTATSELKDVGSTISEEGSKAVETLTEGAESVASKATDGVKNAAEDVGDFFKGKLGW
ncbi:hypothetical protein AC579_3573 [Pseudocercospora musae]|uniref:Uncharacterized protein n=1 Tax=Pseudocercospora musae TaxID=113226 RepID=A0A139IW35_9PEZI|nr:hypothetical protein AC579_3573 [Pseudocercospora musae]KXT18929.1 hypothetical protein AC579_3573 [Pseudocercospora musae]KXT18931.1 hypothetical protein AC579_3573 [Pseudocercospora musae]KXT18933.1 hypothetical protein AC579_3573 [Pseudocercospora musae]KXT18935.1 hypothetical protein AC579_3573 [Pseudocercospora musae]